MRNGDNAALMGPSTGLRSPKKKAPGFAGRLSFANMVNEGLLFALLVLALLAATLQRRAEDIAQGGAGVG